LQKNKRMNFEIYVNQMLKKLNLLFYKKCVKDRDYTIWINDKIDYHIFDYIIKLTRDVIADYLHEKFRKKNFCREEMFLDVF
jgi:hypothetical protein